MGRESLCKIYRHRERYREKSKEKVIKERVIGWEREREREKYWCNQCTLLIDNRTVKRESIWKLCRIDVLVAKMSADYMSHDSGSGAY